MNEDTVRAWVEKAEAFEQLVSKGVDQLTLYAVEVRYPSDFPTPTLEEVQHACDLASMTRQFVRDKLQNEGFSF